MSEIEPAAVAGGVDGLGIDHVETQAVVEGQFLRGTPGVLRVVEVSPLALAGIRARADEPRKVGDIAEQEGRRADAAGAIERRALRVEGQLAGAVVVGRHAQVIGAAHVDAELEGVVAVRSSSGCRPSATASRSRRAGSCSG